MLAEAKSHSMERIKNARVRFDPFPHVYIEEIFPPLFYAEIQNRLLEDRFYRRLLDTGRVAKGYSPARLCLMPSDLSEPETETEEIAFWRALFQVYGDAEFAQLWMRVFEQQISDRFRRGDVPEDVGTGNVTVWHEIFLMRDVETYALPPHTDSPAKIISVLFYLPPNDANAHLGTTLYKPRDKTLTDGGQKHLNRAHFDIVETMPYRANTLFAFPKTSVCFHGVEPVTGSNSRRDIMLMDMKVASPRDILSRQPDNAI